MSGKTRSVYGAVLKHFLNSLKPRGIRGVLVGDDYHGNKFFEIPADPSRGKRYPKRWIVPASKYSYNQSDMPAEWDSWLRNRRSDPPSESEVKANLAIATIKKVNADKIAEKEGKKVDAPVKHTDMSSFPVYDEYEVTPGEEPKKK